MEYRRRRRRAKARYRTRSARTSGGSSVGGAIISLLLIAGIIYVIASSTAGEWVAKNVMAPAIAFFTGAKAETDDGEQANADNTAEPVGEDQTTIDLSEGDSAPVSAQLTFPGVTCYMLQMGVFTSLENANAEAVTLQARGAAGYIMEDASSGATRYRVIAAGYEDYDSAKSVKDRLVSEGTDCTIFTLESVSSVFKVTAPEESITGVGTGFEAISEARKSLAQAFIDFDKNAMTVTEGKAKAAEILSALEADMEPLASFAPDGGALSEILDTYAQIKASFEQLAGGTYESAVDFSASMKYTYLNITDRYAALTEALAG